MNLSYCLAVQAQIIPVALQTSSEKNKHDMTNII